MRESMGLPRRLGDSKVIKALLAERLPAMTKIIEHRREMKGANPPGSVTERTLKSCVQVQLWTEVDGSESLVVSGTMIDSHLELKGLLHDGVFALAHEGEPGYTAT